MLQLFISPAPQKADPVRNLLVRCCFPNTSPSLKLWNFWSWTKLRKHQLMELEGGFIYFSSRRVITLDQADESEGSCHDFTIIYSTPFLCWHNCDYSLSHLVIPSGANSLLPTFRWKPETDTFRICRDEQWKREENSPQTYRLGSVTTLWRHWVLM